MSQAVDYNLVRLEMRKAVKAGLLAQGVVLPPFGVENRGITEPYLDPKKPLWIKETVFRGTQRLESMGYIRAYPQVTYSVYCHQGSGTEVADALANKIARVFEPSRTTILYSGSRRMVVERCQQGDAFVPNETQRAGEGDGLWYVVPVNIVVRLHVNVLSASL